jgi:hypothetical protein
VTPSFWKIGYAWDSNQGLSVILIAARSAPLHEAVCQGAASAALETNPFLSKRAVSSQRVVAVWQLAKRPSRENKKALEERTMTMSTTYLLYLANHP